MPVRYVQNPLSSFNITRHTVPSPLSRLHLGSTPSLSPPLESFLFELGSPLTYLSTAQEKALGKIMSEKRGTDFYTIDKYPRHVRPFYTHPDPTNPSLSNSYDFFMRGQEIMSGAQRIHDYNMLCENMRKNDPPLDPLSEGFKHYTDTFRYGCAPHGGGGLGLNRICQFYLGLPDIRFTTLFPRDPGRLAP